MRAKDLSDLMRERYGNFDIGDVQRYAESAGQMITLVRDAAVALAELPPNVDVEQAVRVTRARLAEEFPEYFLQS